MTKQKEVLTNEELTEIVKHLVKNQTLMSSNMSSFAQALDLITKIQGNIIQTNQNLINRKPDHSHWWQ